MPREGVLDASTLRTISNLASARIRAVDEAGSLDRAYEFARKCDKILSKLVGSANEFYELFSNYHHIVPAPSMMCVRWKCPATSRFILSVWFFSFRNGRLPTKLFTNEYQEKQKQRAKPVRQQKQTQEELEKSRTRPEEVMLSLSVKRHTHCSVGQRVQFGIGRTDDQTNHAYQTVSRRTIQSSRMLSNRLLRIRHRSIILC